MARFLDVAIDIAELMKQWPDARRVLDLNEEATRLVGRHVSSGVPLEAVVEALRSECAASGIVCRG
ncbi:hypothetical protein [Consotaella aegiceratis]|uniref:hypothetical protein n=1 Tax=Consotaella aegiceratis TaxID=3097961 RepID=UPI002F3EFABA